MQKPWELGGTLVRSMKERWWHERTKVCSASSISQLQLHFHTEAYNLDEPPYQHTVVIGTHADNNKLPLPLSSGLHGSQFTELCISFAHLPTHTHTGRNVCNHTHTNT